eukprot:7387593-Prymnesium_polylepis.2
MSLPEGLACAPPESTPTDAASDGTVHATANSTGILDPAMDLIWRTRRHLFAAAQLSSSGPFNDDASSFCEARKRVFNYSVSIGVGLHMLCILLAMAFVNA